MAIKESPSASIAADESQIAKAVLMPGDPLRAKYVAEHYLENPVCFNTVRNMLGYTGTYKGKKISVMGHGMGVPSVGIYSYELYQFFGVDTIIRIGSAGAISPDLKLFDIVIGMSASYNSVFANQFGLPGTYAPTASYSLLKKATDAADTLGLPVTIGNILSNDLFYDDAQSTLAWQKMGVLAVEMESAALYMNAARAGKNALCICTISDSLVTHEECTAEERQNAFTQMMRLALEIA